MLMYPPGGGEPVTVHVTNIDYFLTLGFTKTPNAKLSKSKSGDK